MIDDVRQFVLPCLAPAAVQWSLIRLRNVLTMLVFTFLLNAGLYHRIFQSHDLLGSLVFWLL